MKPQISELQKSPKVRLVPYLTHIFYYTSNCLSCVRTIKKAMKASVRTSTICSEMTTNRNVCNILCGATRRRERSKQQGGFVQKLASYLLLSKLWLTYKARRYKKRKHFECFGRCLDAMITQVCCHQLSLSLARARFLGCTQDTGGNLGQQKKILATCVYQ